MDRLVEMKLGDGLVHIYWDVSRLAVWGMVHWDILFFTIEYSYLKTVFQMLMETECLNHRNVL
ncbi:MAG: hypothetical protein QXR19_17395 [Candidatus Jordarchaeaceae archaeon]